MRRQISLRISDGSNASPEQFMWIRIRRSVLMVQRCFSCQPCTVNEKEDKLIVLMMQ